ncbi:hypothetical protein NDN08_007906 [Rhodosorus marinus]|uniref:ACT domain-containing protein n=1 Tax=Rhodosorus marinus TaxID=101924 RepID=A0AAV8V2H6_9RHOD|nr:hypothetical protein NDN08_007906 [Rhodosorus marinus]
MNLSRLRSCYKRISAVVECPDQLGIVASITNFLSSRNANITAVDQYLAPLCGDEVHSKDGLERESHSRSSDAIKNFIMRFEFSYTDSNWTREDIESDMDELERNLNGKVTLRYESEPLSLAILLSKSSHCADELLYRWRTGELPCKITSIMSNHKSAETLAKAYDLPFVFVDVSRPDKSEGEILGRVVETTDLLVLARYMQILSSHFLDSYKKPIINIHHGLLPAFKGARPYHQMYEAGVKIIGATAHYVSPQLDAGPIIQQDVAPVNHRMSIAELKQVGIGLERSALVSGVKKHLENKLVRFGDRVIVF